MPLYTLFDVLHPFSMTDIWFKAAADAMKHEPLNSIDFDALWDGRLDITWPCGRDSPWNFHGSSPDLTTALLAAVTSLVALQIASKPASFVFEIPLTPVKLFVTFLPLILQFLL